MFLGLASTTVTWSPSSPQLRLALRCRNAMESRAVLDGAPTRKFGCHHRPRFLSVARSRSEGMRWRRNGASRIVAAGTTADTFSGWSDDEHVEDPIDFKRNEGFGGIIGAGLAGLVLVAGLSFAAMALGNQNTPRPKVQLGSLIAQQEVLLASDTESDKVEKNESEKALQVHTGKVLVPAVVHQGQGQAFAALQALKVIEADAQPSDLCIRRE